MCSADLTYPEHQLAEDYSPEACPQFLEYGPHAGESLHTYLKINLEVFKEITAQEKVKDYKSILNYLYDQRL